MLLILRKHRSDSWDFTPPLRARGKCSTLGRHNSEEKGGRSRCTDVVTGLHASQSSANSIVMAPVSVSVKVRVRGYSVSYLVRVTARFGW